MMDSQPGAEQKDMEKQDEEPIGPFWLDVDASSNHMWEETHKHGEILSVSIWKPCRKAGKMKGDREE